MTTTDTVGYIFLIPTIYGLTHLAIYYIIEPIVMFLFRKPLYVHFYLQYRQITLRQKDILYSEVEFFRRLSPKRKRYFEHRVEKFLRKYQFHGVEGLEVTDQMRILIASTYVKLTFGFRLYLFPVFNKIILYPGIYHSTVNDMMHKGEFNPMQRAVVFSWEDYLSGYEHRDDNINLGIHEFTHVMHHWLIRREDNGSALFLTLHKKLMREVLHSPNAKALRESGYFREYAFENDYEFLAVVIENFFETPESFSKRFPELYMRIRQLVNVDPLGD